MPGHGRPTAGNAARGPQDSPSLADTSHVEQVQEQFDPVDAARRGDSSCLAELWRRYAGPVAAYARSRGSWEPDDLVSEVFLCAFRQLPTFVGDESAFRSLLFTITHRRVVDEVRRRGRRVATVSLDTTRDTAHRVVASAEDCALGRSSDARRLLETLAPDQRDVLMLRIFGDLTVDQIAAVLGKRPGAVKALQRRGLEALRRRLPASPVLTTFDTEGRD